MAQIHKNISFAGIGQFLYTILAFILIPFATRYLDNDGYGLYTLAATLGFFITMAGDLGLSTLLTREISKNRRPASRLFFCANGIKTATTPIAVGVLLIYLKLGGFDAIGIQAILIFALSSIFSAFTQAIFAVFRGFEKIQYETLGVFIDKLLSVTLGILFLVLEFDIRVFISSFLIAAVVKFALALFYLTRKFIPFGVTFNLTRSRVLLRTAVPFGISVFLAMCYNYLDIIMLSVMTNLKEVGLYSVSYKLLSLTTIIPTVLTTAFLPQLSIHFRDSKTLSALFLKGCTFLFIFSFPMIPFVFLLPKEIILLISGPGWDGSDIALQILVFAAFAQMLNSFFVPLYAAVNLQNKIVRYQIIGLVVNIVLNSILIPIISFRGAAIATVATEWIILVFIFRWARQKILKKHIHLLDGRFILKIAAATILMTGSILILQRIRITGITLFLLVAGIYLLGLQITGAIGFKSILKSARKFIQSKRKQSIRE
ncbi:flippase [candidate division KSB1 bacterium]|nr:flippase [candidate division KSB1 bacterium]